MTLGELLRRVPEARLQGDPSLPVTDVTYDSRRVSPGSLFVAIRGAVTDGNRFVDAARKKGAAAIVSEQAPEGAGPWVQVPDAREALALFSAAVLRDPAQSLRLIGVTGTNGKTTTTYLIDAALRAAGHTVGLLGTVHYRVGGRLVEASRTTPESSDLQALFRQMVDEGCTDAVMEVSSHSLELKRVHGCAFQVAVFTNLTRDHLDFHGDMESYFAAKRRLFDTYLREDGHAVINADDDRAPALTAAARGKVWTYGLEAKADVSASGVALSLKGTRFRTRTPRGEFDVETPLIGRFNVENFLAGLTAALALDIDPAVALRGLLTMTGVPGRLERVNAGQDFAVIVDYAHTDDALKNLLETVRELKPRRLITVFGCGGDRDRTKRPLMGAVASRLSDVVVVTSDNPRSEPPEAILDEIQRGMPNGTRRGERYAIVDRREAIGRALEMAGPGDAVVIAGKGHETYQVLRDRTVPFDDRQVARELIAGLSLRGRKA
ncbi:MAG TPA: UDP-N-acetylmuramoyl-L-alanyl-D-glutamate--2,6-diaminopimelate ligase [Vicinamibacteria bacterium]|nr:UDP-N-acetylmuramoyl-L-alanyl-D-glutamate--2,6-diaminopimelate ligase [Vicinamibacteria bacterium]